MKHSRKIKNYVISLLIMAFLLSTLAILPACKQAQHNVQLSTKVPVMPETPAIVPECTFVPTPIHPEPTEEPSSEEPTSEFIPSPTPYVMSLYSNPHDCYTNELKKLLHSDRPIVSAELPFPFDPIDGLSTYLLYIEGKLIVRSYGLQGYYMPSYWTYSEPETVFTFPNPDIWYDIFPPGAALAGQSDPTKCFEADTEIIIPEYNQDPGYNQHPDGCLYPVIFGGDWMIVYSGADFDNSFFSHFHGQDEWAEKNLSTFPHTWILRTDDGWNTWEHIDSVEADTIASEEHCPPEYPYHFVDSDGYGHCNTFSIFGAHISSNGVGYISYRIARCRDGWMNSLPGIMELVVTTDWGKHWTLVTRENASEFGLSINTCGIQLTYSEGLHCIAIFAVRNTYKYKEEFGTKYTEANGEYFAESFDGGKTWKRISDYILHDAYFVTKYY